MTKGSIQGQGQGHGRRDRGLAPNIGLGKKHFLTLYVVCVRVKVGQHERAIVGCLCNFAKACSVAGVPRAGHGDGLAPGARGGLRAHAGGDLTLKTSGGAPGQGG